MEGTICFVGDLVGPTWKQGGLGHLPLMNTLLDTHIWLCGVGKLKLPGGDAADFLVASAKVFGWTLVPSDEPIIASADVPILSNR